MDEYNELMNKLIETIKSKDSLENSSDYNITGILPGQQLYYDIYIGPFHITHHAIYLGNGKIFEGGIDSGTFRRLINSLLSPYVRIKSLEKFMERAKKFNSPVYIIKQENDAEKEEIINRFERIKKILTDQTFFHPLKLNCERLANYISFNKKFSVQAELWKSTFYIMLIILLVAVFVAVYYKSKE